MCATCGCSDSHHHHHHHPQDGTSRLLQVEKDLLAKNDRYAEANRQWLAERGILALNLVASPGAGKTSLLVRTLRDLATEAPFAVIEGDQQTSLDADRIQAAGAAAVQINTGKGCHLDAHQVGHALRDLDPAPGAAVMIENVGNLVCPAGFDLGEDGKVVVLSVTEGEDKPLKYPHMFHAARLMVLSKIDLLPHVDFDVQRCIAYARRINPDIEVVQVSAKTGEGLEDWYRWLRAMRGTKTEKLPESA
ncbi:MAG: hydrogenase nickel incorporation protein HypB [Methylohalobius crimeensis]